MPTKETASTNKKVIVPRKRLKPGGGEFERSAISDLRETSLAQRALQQARLLNPNDVLSLQRVTNNQAVVQLLESAMVQKAPEDETTPKVQLGAETPLSLNKLKGLNRKMASIYNEYGKYLTEKAAENGIDVASAAAVVKVESGGQGFDTGTGQMIIRFENHVFNQLWGKNNAEEFAKHFKYSSKKKWEGHYFRADENGEWETFHGDQAKEWTVLQYARALDDEAALQSISMGAAQIMGGNYSKIGYTSAREMFDQMSGGTAANDAAALSCPVVDPEAGLLATKAQLDGLFAFIKDTKLCIDGLKEKNYEKFAKGYNGSGQAKAYGDLISDAADAYTKVTSSSK